MSGLKNFSTPIDGKDGALLTNSGVGKRNLDQNGDAALSEMISSARCMHIVG